jgi:hypothetical protein
MNPRLHIFKNENAIDYSQGRHIRFAVVDLDKSKHYPENYICLLPLDPRANPKAHTNFSKIFGNNSFELAKRLLTKAMKTEKDSEIKAEIKKRLRIFEPKQPVQVKCSVCGNLFEPRRRRHRRAICQECTQKKYASQQ